MTQNKINPQIDKHREVGQKAMNLSHIAKPLGAALHAPAREGPAEEEEQSQPRKAVPKEGSALSRYLVRYASASVRKFSF